MKVFDILKTANGNLRRSVLRTFLTSSAVFIGALTLMLTTGVGYGLRNYVEEQVKAAGAKDALIITPKQEGGGAVSNNEATPYDPDQKAAGLGFTQAATLDQSDIEIIKDTKNIISVEPLYLSTVEYIGNGEKKFRAVVTQGLEGLQIPLSAGRLVDANGPNYEITIAPTLVEPLGFDNPEQAVGKTIDIAYKNAQGDIFTYPVNIVGVQEKTFIQGNAMNISIKLARDAFLQASQGLPDFQRLQYITAVAKFDTSISPNQLDELKQDLDGMGFSANTLDDQLGLINTIISGITTFLNIFAAIALAAASFGIVNTLLMAVQERTKEIGLMKALGMSKNKIFLLFSLEAILIGIWSSILALLAANVLGRIGSNIASSTILQDFEGLELFSFPAMPMLGIIALVTSIAFIASTLPASKASRMNPIEALRYE